MPKYIDVSKVSIPKGFFEQDLNIPKLLNWLNDQPDAEVAPVLHGKWEIRDLTVYCSNCNCTNRHIPIIAGRRGIYFSRGSKPPFCEKCGAKMDE